MDKYSLIITFEFLELSQVLPLVLIVKLLSTFVDIFLQQYIIISSLYFHTYIYTYV